MKTANRWLPTPFVSLVVLAVWLLLWNEVTALILASGVVLAVLLAALGRHSWPSAPGLGSFGALARLVAVVAWDIVVANLVVAAIVLVRGPRVRPARIVVPLDIEHPFVATVLASTVSLTPGTLSAALDLERRELEVHCLHLDEDPEQVVARIKTRYEARLKQVFRC